LDFGIENEIDSLPNVASGLLFQEFNNSIDDSLLLNETETEKLDG
jgi:hypothetical protein